MVVLLVMDNKSLEMKKRIKSFLHFHFQKDATLTEAINDEQPVVRFFEYPAEIRWKSHLEKKIQLCPTVVTNLFFCVSRGFEGMTR